MGRVQSAPLLLFPGIPLNANAAFLATYDGLLVESYDSFIVGISAKSGRIQWTFAVDSPITAPLGYDFTRGNM